MSKLDLAIVSQNSIFHERSESIANIFEFKYYSFRSDENFFEESANYKKITFVILDCSKLEKSNELAGAVQVARQAAPNSYILTVVSSKLSAEDARLVKTSGASLVIMEAEYFSSSKVEFILTQIIRSSYIPIKVADLISETEVDFSLYYLMPANKKFLKVLKPGHTLKESFLSQYNEVGELYIHRDDLKSWTEYAKSFCTDDQDGLIRKCRLKFLQLSQSFLNLALLIADRSSASSFSQGRELYEVCESFALDLLNSLNGINDPWDTISNAAIGDFGSIERAPTIAAYAGLLSARSGIGKPVEIMIGALFCDLGYLDLDHTITQKIRINKIDELSPEAKKQYEQHPTLSLNLCLSRKLSLSEAVKNIILLSHERADQKGFPNQVRTEKLTEESMLVRLCWDMDSRAQVQLGKERVSIKKVKEGLSQSIMSESDNYSLVFLMKINKYLKEPIVNQAHP
ncbi:MAG: hypothetical protein ACXVCY_01345 [Pseudobdellovibrionaceae bacterium]